VSHSKVGQQLLGLTLRVNSWLWNWAQIFFYVFKINWKIQCQ